MTTEKTTDANESMTMGFVGEDCFSLGDVVCLRSGGPTMTVEDLSRDASEGSFFTDGMAFVVWAKEDGTMVRDQFRTEMLDNFTAAAEVFGDVELSQAIAEAMADKADTKPKAKKPYTWDDVATYSSVTNKCTLDTEFCIRTKGDNGIYTVTVPYESNGDTKRSLVMQECTRQRDSLTGEV